MKKSMHTSSRVQSWKSSAAGNISVMLLSFRIISLVYIKSRMVSNVCTETPWIFTTGLRLSSIFVVKRASKYGLHAARKGRWTVNSVSSIMITQSQRSPFLLRVLNCFKTEGACSGGFTASLENPGILQKPEMMGGLKLTVYSYRWIQLSSTSFMHFACRLISRPFTTPSFWSLAYCKQSRARSREGMGTRLVGLSEGISTKDLCSDSGRLHNLFERNS